MKPWDIKAISKKMEDEFVIPLWAPFFPKDFYFAIRTIRENDNKIAVVYIVPVEYYDSKGRMFFDSMPIVGYLPTYLEETTEGVYEADPGISQSQVQTDLENLGFVHSNFFQSYVNANAAVFEL